MSTFKALFGIEASQVKKTCLLMPFILKGMLKELEIKKLEIGKLYSSGENDLFTVIHTGLGVSLLGDAVLYLKETKCENIILFGSCGLVKKMKDINIGSLVSPDKCYSLESFSEMLLNEQKKDFSVFYPDKDLLSSLLNKGPHIKEVTCATVSSLKLEETYIDIFNKNGIEALDMECSALFSAASAAGIKATALFYVTDIIKKLPFYRDMSPEDKRTLYDSIRSSTSILWNFIKET
ncbi:MAG: hypothetical protein ABH848_02375 [Candidatus Omnitrophota bacterium]